MSERCIHLNWLKQLRSTSLFQGSVLRYKTSGTLPGTVSSLRHPHFVCGSSCQDKEDFRELCFTSRVELRLCILRTPWNFSVVVVVVAVVAAWVGHGWVMNPKPRNPNLGFWCGCERGAAGYGTIKQGHYVKGTLVWIPPASSCIIPRLWNLSA